MIDTIVMIRGDALDSTCKYNTFMENALMNNDDHLSPKERVLIMIERDHEANNNQWLNEF
ncbi:hypothetical protein [bacterium endosymbiont of Bathymodiolus sp. 5 South]|jgi:hypothetical protein|uniref:hypothetical protein n=1 Tax=bacterium endosymbiont of Bathymodiolus sp. 5 South TaxID=1181670 RepID=UPI0010B99E96|nr:hypothetical protein [bacterium endosymbiont of Bathymodiolus sp. 5 South]CAC9442222.1 hypothetical protein [uncultured Gammaproteobacteria bacterium]SHN90788.1 hypothetical protein BCLUESOX_987 [bacterium endosymbiont of Bathymodiolus sp. 5 South]VVH58120.1 hypothetical protein BSPCLSOX_616 [uncultured Gammaproteobacteria bacterium]VVH63238.1 hypothetical protein BSPWISOX_2462 [uncultured Gammaproteobacteria bacterium]VVM27368.1 hypothetical protein BSPWISOXPB_10340 [uncultured Gammaproteo